MTSLNNENILGIIVGNFNLQVGNCIYCSKQGILQCSACKQSYCSYNCQQLHWPIHYKICMPKLILKINPIKPNSGMAVPQPPIYPKEVTSSTIAPVNMEECSLPTSDTVEASYAHVKSEDAYSERIASNDQQFLEARPVTKDNEVKGSRVGIMNHEFMEGTYTSELSMLSNSPGTRHNIIQGAGDQEIIKSYVIMYNLPLLANDKPVNLLVTHINEEEFYALVYQDAMDATTYSSMEMYLRNMKETYLLEKDQVYPGDCVIAFSEEFCEWYRAKIIEMTDKGAVVFFLDYGSVESVGELAMLPKECHLPTLLMRGYFSSDHKMPSHICQHYQFSASITAINSECVTLISDQEEIIICHPC